jgi:hypothetical protein
MRNIHNFEYTHGHHNDYKTSMRVFKEFDRNSYKYVRVRKNANESQMELGRKWTEDCEPESRRNFKLYRNYTRVKPIIKKDEGIGINEEQGQPRQAR